MDFEDPAPPRSAPSRPIVRDLTNVRVPKAPSSFTPAARPLPPLVRPRGPRPVTLVVPVPATKAVPSTVLVPELPPSTATGRMRSRRWPERRWFMVAVGILGAALLIFWQDGASWVERYRIEQWKPPTDRLFTADDWFHQAQQRALAGDFRLALGAVKYALNSAPKNGKLLKFEGDMHQSLFQFPEAQAAYERALEVDPRNRAARQNLLLCQRINRYRQDPAAHLSTLYGLHRVMLGQQRISEAVAISQRMGSDHALQQATWQAALDNTGLRGKITVGENGALALDLTHGGLHPNLSLLQGYPITSLNAADTGLDDVQALRGLAVGETEPCPHAGA